MRTRRLCVFTVLVLFLVGTRSFAANQTFQALGYIDSLAIIGPPSLLTAGSRIRSDAGSKSVSVYTSIARDPVSGKVFIVGNDIFNGNSYLGQVNFTSGLVTTVGMIPGERVDDLVFDGAGNLYGLTVKSDETTPQTLLAIDKATASASVVKILDSHGGGEDEPFDGAIAWNPGDGFFYYANKDQDGYLFLDKIAPGTFTQTPVNLVVRQRIHPNCMAFVEGRIWISDGIFLWSADVSRTASGFSDGETITFPSAGGEQFFSVRAIFPTAFSCIPSPTVACLHNRFKVEVTYDATPQNGSGAGKVVLGSPQSVKFSFLDPQSIDLVVKILNACAPPVKKWRVFVGGLTNLGVSIKVTDTATGAVKIYSNKKGKLFPSISDTLNCP